MGHFVPSVVRLPFAFTACITANLGDVTTTLYGFHHGVSEANPFAIWLLVHSGEPMIVLYKMLLVIIIIGIKLVADRSGYGYFTTSGVWGATVVTAFFVLNNIGVLLGV